MSTFVAKGASYQADHNSHDDLMMNLVMFGWFTSTSFFAESTDVNMKHMLYKQKVKQMEDEVIPVGHMPQQDDHHDLVTESIKVFGQDIIYLPRTRLAEDALLNEEWSEFTQAYPIEVYVENVEGFLT